MPGLSPGLTRARVSDARGRASQVSPVRRQQTGAGGRGVSPKAPYEASGTSLVVFVLLSTGGRITRTSFFCRDPGVLSPSVMIFSIDAFISATFSGITAARFFVFAMSSARLWSGTSKLGPRHGGGSRLGETAEGRAFLWARGRGPCHAAMMVRSTRRSRAGLVCFALNGGPPGERRLLECGTGVALLGHPIP